jgi:hypothetical protein
MEFFNSLLGDFIDRAADAEAVLKEGLRHVAVAFEQKPSSVQARDVAASLHFCLAQSYSRSGRIDEAAPLFQQAVEEIESLCASFPWNPDYWNTAHWFHGDTITTLLQAGRDEEAKAAARRMAEWVRTAAPRVPEQPQPQQFLKDCQQDVIRLLHATGQDREADELDEASRGERPRG